MRLIKIILLWFVIIFLAGFILYYKGPIEGNVNLIPMYNSTDINSEQNTLQNSSYENSQAIINISRSRTNHNYNRNLALKQTVESDIGLNQEKIKEFPRWARLHNIELIGIDKTSKEVYENGLKVRHYMNYTNVSGFSNVVNGLHKIPEPLLKIMKGKTIYLSHQWGRGYAVLGSWPEQGILKGVNKGIILEQPINEEDLIHEFGHMVGLLGIQDIYKDEDSSLEEIEPLYNEVFKVRIEYDPNLQISPEGYIDVYSTTNDQENFAQHFTYYILYGEYFREIAKSDPLLKNKYDFLKEELFDGREY